MTDTSADHTPPPALHRSAVVAIALLLVQGWMVARRPSCAACDCSP
jgi:hypothetical protein